ncbi:hypothetical protein JYU34_003088 [Plutella xylostella]|nr:hypothetical protein JYU34_003084 [Plutella xylostella]KAG7310320.1 hypothetical protein JYU34_003086 [Plutella xylostella]KAG7310322.1 hypothetical protein JYU34_003088 [Plutella xylostella]
MNETKSPASRVGVTLPRFNPDAVELDARSWCAAAEPCAARRAVCRAPRRAAAAGPAGRRARGRS